MTGVELIRVEEPGVADRPRLHMIHRRCRRCGEDWWSGYIDTGFVAWGEFTCDPCIKLGRLERGVQLLEATVRRGTATARHWALLNAGRRYLKAYNINRETS